MEKMNPSNMAKPGGHYAHGVRAQGLLFISGQLPIAPDGEKPNDAPFAAQVKQVFDNIDAVLAASGVSNAALVSVRVYVTDIALWPEFNTLYANWLGSHTPARAVVPVPTLHYGFKIEMEAIAEVPML
jgi:2-iminobutanoate/2-iminopropanoate deaminase